MIISDGWFQGKEAELKANATGNWVKVGEDIEFCVKDGKFYFSIDDVGYAEDFHRIYGLLLKEA